MIVEIAMPNMGLTLSEATLVRWFKAPGDPVRKGEPLFEIETDKAVQEIESEVDGVVAAHLAREGDVIQLGAAVGTMETQTAVLTPQPPFPRGEGGGGTEDAVASRTAGLVAQATSIPDSPRAGSGLRHSPLVPASGASAVGTSAERERREPASGGWGVRTARPMASPRARRAAERLGIDLNAVTATGAKGQHIRERDVLSAAAAMAAVSPAPAPRPETVVSAIRRLTAERTTASFRDTPHFYLTQEVDATRLVALREEICAGMEADIGVRLTLTDLFVKAVALALRSVPALNACWNEGAIAVHDTCDVSLAVSTDRGVLAPVLRGVDALSLANLARMRADLVARTRAGRIGADELTGGSFTLSNLGALGVDQFEAVINPPQSGILAVGAVRTRPFVIDGLVSARQTAYLTISVDHRVTDGADAARFLMRIAQLLEKPVLLGVL